MNPPGLEVDIAAFARARADTVAVIDVREPFEYVIGHVPGAQLLPLSSLAARAHEIPRGRPVYLICASGNRSLLAARALARAGIDARSVAGGTTAWTAAGHPVVRGSRAA